MQHPLDDSLIVKHHMLMHFISALCTVKDFFNASYVYFKKTFCTRIYKNDRLYYSGGRGQRAVLSSSLWNLFEQGRRQTRAADRQKKKKIKKKIRNIH
jgi:hypothetical protein